MQCTKALKKWQKTVDAVYAKRSYYVALQSGITVSSAELTSQESKDLLGTCIPELGLHALLITVNNSSDQTVNLRCNDILLPLLSQELVLATIYKDFSYIRAGLITYGIGLGLLWVGFSITTLCFTSSAMEVGQALLWPLVFAYEALSKTTLLALVAPLILEMLVLIPLVVAGLTLLFITLYRSSTDATIRHHALNPKDTWELQPGERLDKIIFVPELTNTHNFTLTVRQAGNPLSFFVTL